MLHSRHEQYEQLHNDLPFVLNADIHRTPFNLSSETNWHENLEIQFCTKGTGTLLMDGVLYPFTKQDIAVVNSNVIHYTATDAELCYDALIIGTDFCKQLHLSAAHIRFAPMSHNQRAAELFMKLKAQYADRHDPLRIAKLYRLLSALLIELAGDSTPTASTENNRPHERIKGALVYIREHYAQKITLEDIARAALCDKYTLCKDFKKYTGQTVFQNLNHYRCMQAVEHLLKGCTVADTAAACGFDNLSFFSKTFKRYVGQLPSAYKTHHE